MAVKSDGEVVIEITADDKKLSEGLNRVDEKAKSLSSELSRVEKLLELDPKNIELVEQREKLLNETISNTSEKLELLENAQLEANRAFAKGEVSEEQYRSLQREIIKTEQELRTLTRQTEKQAEAAEQVSEKTEKLTSGTGAMATAFAAAGTALAALTGKAVSAATEYEAAFAMTQTIMDAAQVGTAEMNAEVLALSKNSAMAAGTVSEAVYQAISGSVATADAAEFVEKANKLAVSGFTALESATDILTTTLNAYHMKAEQVEGISNVLIRTQNLGKTSVDQLAANMGRAIATGSAYGVNLQNIAASYVELTRSGIATAEATTYLSGMLNELGKADSDVAAILQEGTGKSFGQLMADGSSLGDVLQVLSDRVDGNAEAFMGLWGSQEAAKAANALLSMSVADFNNVLGQMNDELEGTTGTTETAYNTMTHTSDFIDRKFSNSINNLAISFGGALNPMLDGAKELLTKIVEHTTELIDKYPALAYIGAGVVAGIAAISVSLALYALKLKLATAETLAFTAAMNSNGITALISAIGMLMSVLVTFIAYLAASREELDALTVASDKLEETMQNAGETLADSRAEIEASAAAASTYVDRLEQMERAGVSTNEEAEAWHATLVMLTETIPELADYIDLETDSIEGGTAALRAHIDAWRENAKQQAYQDYLSSYYSETAQAEIELEKNKIKLYAAQEKQNAAFDRYNRLLARQTELENEAKKAAEEYGNQYGTLEDASNFLSAEYSENEETLSRLLSEYEDAKETVKDYNDAVDYGTRTLAAAREEMSYAQQAYEELMGPIREAADETDFLSIGQRHAAAAFTAAADELSEAYTQIYTAARESIDGQIGLFQSFDPIVAESVDSMIAALDSETAFLADYTENLRAAAAKGVDREILQALDDGSAESAKRLAGIAAATDEQIAELNQKWKEVGEGKDRFAEGIAEYTGVLEDEKQVLIDLMADAGVNMADALTGELLSGLPRYLEALRQYEPSFDLGGSRNNYPGLGNHGYATGTVNAATGFALVGERGPELVYFRGGERVLTAEETRSTLAAIYPAAPTLRASGAGLPSSVGGGSVRLQASVYVPLEIDGREFARATAEYMGEEMEFEVI